jgi:hypothetical protein
MTAYIVRETHGDGSCVRFAEQSVVARREGANELDTDFEAVECHRAGEFDAYAPGPVPDPVLVEHGWWFECMQCNQRISSEPTDEDGEPIELAPVYEGSWIFCTPKCQEAFKAERAAEKARGEAASAAALKNWPGITVRYTNGYETPARVDFAFPGGEGSVTWRLGEATVRVQQRDVEAWHRFAESCRSQLPASAEPK